MLLSTPTRVPVPPAVPTRIPSPVSTPVPVGVSVAVPTVVPSPPSIPTERPYMYGLKQVAASQVVGVLSAAGVKLLVSGGESVAFPSWGSAAVSGSAVLQPAFPRAAANSTAVSGAAVLRPTLSVRDSITVTGTATLRPVVTLTATASTTVSGFADVTQETQIWGGTADSVPTGDALWGGQADTATTDSVSGGDASTTTQL